MDQDRLERIIAGPWIVHEGNRYTLEQLQEYRFTKHMTNIERAHCRAAAMHLLEHYDLVPKKAPAEPVTVPVTKVSKTQTLILLTLAAQDPEAGVHTLKSHAVLLQMEERDVRLAARALARKGLAERTYLFNEYSGHIVGSGYILTAAGKKLAAEIGGA